MSQRSRRRPVTSKQLVEVWNQERVKPDKKVRVFNQHSNSLKGKIKISNNVHINYDYSGEYPRTVIHKKDKLNHIDKDKFELTSYPKLKTIITEIPKSKNQSDMDLFLMRDIDEALLWKNNEFEFHS